MAIYCENCFCIYCEGNYCILKNISLNIQGSCEECIYIPIPEKECDLLKKRLRKIYLEE